MATLDTEIRRLEPIALNNLEKILNQSNSWKKLMSRVPKDDNESEYLFTSEHFTMIENAIHEQKKSGAEIFLTEWSTLGRKRPTCGKMLDLLVKAELFRAADYLAVDVLKCDPPERPKRGPAAPIDIEINELLKQQAAEMKSDSLVIAESPIQCLQYAEKSSDVVAATTEKAEDSKEKSDLIKFSEKEINLMQSNEFIEKNDAENLQEKMSDLMKFSTKEISEANEEKSFVFEEVKSEFIPLFVKEQGCLQSSKVSEISQSSSVVDTETTIDSSDVFEDMVHSKPPIVAQQISQDIIPVVVCEFNQTEQST